MELPPLNALRAFEAAARNLSFRIAARELFVTPGAVSQQVKALEQYLGVTVFERVGRGVHLTDAGRRLYPVLRSAFQNIGETAEALRLHNESGPLTVSLPPALAMKWLLPRLPRFRELHPEIDVRVRASTHLVNFSLEGVDVAIRCGGGEYPGLRSDWLMYEEAFAVCSPQLLEHAPPLRTPADLRHHTLLHDESGSGWGLWLQAQGVHDVDTDHGPTFSDATMALQAAIEGQGVALSYTPLAYLDLAAGRLVRPLPQATTSNYAYFVVCPEETAGRPKVAAFREWTFAEAARDGHRPPPHVDEPA